MSINKITNAPTPNEHIAKTNEVVDFCNNLVIPTVGNGTITITQGGTTKGSFTTNQSGNATIALDTGSASGVTDVKVDNASVVSGGVANIDLTGYAQKSGAIFSGDVYAQSLYQKSTINPSNYVQSLTAETVDTYSANKTLSNIGSTNSPNFDGKWVASKIDLPSMGTNVSTYKYNLKNQLGTGITAVDYLPNDNYQYEVSLSVYSSNTSYGGSSIEVYSDIVMGNATVAEKAASKYGTANIILPVSSLLTVEISKNRVNNITVTLIGYRRIGTNT